MVDLAAKKKQAEKVKAGLQSSEHAEAIEEKVALIRRNRELILEKKNAVVLLNAVIKGLEAGNEVIEEELKELLMQVEQESGYTKMPLQDGGVVYVRKGLKSYKIVDEDKVPTTYLALKPVLDKTMIKNNIEAGHLDKELHDGIWISWVDAKDSVVIK